MEVDEDNELTDISDISDKVIALTFFFLIQQVACWLIDLQEVTTVELSEVRVSLGGSSSISDLSTPPPLPVSLPPDEEDRQFTLRELLIAADDYYCDNLRHKSVVELQ